jgi:hypothetical protein
VAAYSADAAFRTHSAAQAGSVPFARQALAQPTLRDMKAAKALGLTVPAALLNRADKVIE